MAVPLSDLVIGHNQWMEFIAVVVAFASAGLAVYRDRRSPLAWSLCMWAVILLLFVLRPVQFHAMNWTTVTAISLGLAGLALPTLLPNRDHGPTDQGVRAQAFRRYVIVAGVLLVLLIVGVLAFRITIANAVGHPYESLTPTQIRAAQNGAARGGGLLVLLGSLAPVVSCVGIYGAYRFSRWWWALSAVAFLLIVQNPARTGLLSLLVISVIFWLYARRALSKTDVPPGPRKFPIIPVALAVAAGLVYFIVAGALLSKNGTANAYSNWLPGWMVTPTIYFLGGVAAFSAATSTGFDPYHWGTSIYTPLRLLSGVIHSIHAPDTIAKRVHAPMSFNDYTGFGQIYFDFGLTGVFVLCAILGAIAIIAHRRAEAGRMEWAWVASATAALLLSLPQGFRLMNLDVLFYLTVGVVAFLVIRWPGRRWMFWLHRRTRSILPVRTVGPDRLVEGGVVELGALPHSRSGRP